MKSNKTKVIGLSPIKVFAIALGFLTSISSPVGANSQLNHFVNLTFELKQNILISSQKDPPNRGTPPSREGTGSRGDCLYKQDKPPLTRLVGGTNSKLTVNNYPTLWFYIPYTRQESPLGQFYLQDEKDEIYKTSFQLPDKPGIVSISLPSTVKPLEVGKTYRWYLDITCPSKRGSKEATTPASLTGVVEKIKPSSALENELKTATNPVEQIKIYAKNGIWIDALTEVVKQRQKQPDNSTFKQLWVELLRQPQINLSSIAQEPIIGEVK
jgi:Domain of Unknown Function (DUF928)